MFFMVSCESTFNDLFSVSISSHVSSFPVLFSCLLPTVPPTPFTFSGSVCDLFSSAGSSCCCSLSLHERSVTSSAIRLASIVASSASGLASLVASSASGLASLVTSIVSKFGGISVCLTILIDLTTPNL
ncbi:hypothetical protein Hanom_Chr11g01038961 [Helianthus anomalus]